MKRSRHAAMLAASLLLAPTGAAAGDVIHVAYNERPPYLITQADGTPGGLTGAPAASAFRNAGIAVQWLKVPTNRQLLMVRDAHEKNCAIGWFDIPARSAYSKATRPIYRDHGWVVLTNAAFAARGVATLHDLMQLRDVRLLVKDNYSYGALDPLIRQWQTTTAVSTANASKMVQSVGAGLVDLMFVTEDEGRYILGHPAGEHAANLRLLRFKDMPRGAERTILCSKAVPDDVITRLNQAINFR